MQRRFLLNYFGEEYPSHRCDRCDEDLLHTSAVPSTDGQQDGQGNSFSLGEEVVHKAWGAGTVQRVVDGKVTVLFKTAGYKTLVTRLVQEQGLLAKKPALA